MGVEIHEPIDLVYVQNLLMVYVEKLQDIFPKTKKSIKGNNVFVSRWRMLKLMAVIMII